MSSDVLAETLEALRLRGTAYFKADFRAPWGMAVPAKDVATFHVVVQGQCWLRVPGETWSFSPRAPLTSSCTPPTLMRLPRRTCSVGPARHRSWATVGLVRHHARLWSFLV